MWTYLLPYVRSYCRRASSHVRQLHLRCLRSLSSSTCPLCRKFFQPDSFKKLHLSNPPELNNVEKGGIDVRANLFLQRLALVSVEGTPEADVIEVLTEVRSWLYSQPDDSHVALRASIAALRRFKALQDQSERAKVEYRHLHRQFRDNKQSANLDSKISRAVEESLRERIQQIESEHTQELESLHSELNTLRNSKSRYLNTAKPLPTPPKLLPIDHTSAFTRSGQPSSSNDTVISGVPCPAPSHVDSDAPSALNQSSHKPFIPVPQTSKSQPASHPGPSEPPGMQERRASAHHVDTLDSVASVIHVTSRTPYQSWSARLIIKDRLSDHEGGLICKGRGALGMSLAEEDWVHARETLKNLKAGPMKRVKGDKELKSQWSAIRRQITLKIGQLTRDFESITRITEQIRNIIRPPSPLPQDIYVAALSSLAKAILLQAEAEVTIEKRSAVPLSMVTATLLGTLQGFSDIFFAKLVQRSGGWPIPMVIPPTDADGTAWNEEQRTKAMGYQVNDEKQRESLSDHIMRISGMMRVYFLILTTPVPQPLDKMFRLTHFWTYFARMMGDERLLETAVAAEVLYIALDVGGTEAKFIWGHQWVKLLELLYEGATTGIGGATGKLLGGKTPEGMVARVRVKLQIERIMETTSLP